MLVDGLGASGKSTFAASLVRALPAPPAVVRGDDFIRRGTTDWDQARFVDQVVVPVLVDGQTGGYLRWPWDADAPTEWVEVQVGPVVLEGIAVSELDVPVGVRTLRVWIETPDTDRVARAEHRDPARFACWRDEWRPVESAWAAATRPWDRADLVVDGRTLMP